MDKVANLLAAGRMRARGLAEVAAAQRDGRWARAYPSQRTATVPLDLAAALAHHPRAERAFAGASKTARYGVILKVLTTTTPQARTSAVRQVVADLLRTPRE